MTYTIEITETLSCKVEIVANSEAEALAKANKLYQDEAIVLSAEHHVGNTELKVC